MTKKSIFLLCLAQFLPLISAEAVEKKTELISVPNEYEVGNGFVGMQRDVVRLLERKILEIAPDDTVQKLKAIGGVDAILAKQLQRVHKTDQIYASCFETMLLEKSLTKWRRISIEDFTCLEYKPCDSGGYILNEKFVLDPAEIISLVYGNGIYVALLKYKTYWTSMNRLCVSRDGGEYWSDSYHIDICDVTFANGRFIAFGEYRGLYESSDGKIWRTANIVFAKTMPTVATSAIAEPIVLQDGCDTVFSYDNGKAWYRSSLYNLAFGKDTFVGYDAKDVLFCGDKNNILAFNEEKKRCEMLFSKTNLVNNKRWMKFVYGNGIFIGKGESDCYR